MTENLTLEAHWTAKQYVVMLDKNADDAELSSTQAVVTYDSKFELPVPTRENYYFNGWFLGTEIGSAQYATSTGACARLWRDAEDGIILYASWTPSVIIIG